MSSDKITESELDKLLLNREEKKLDEKQRWVNRIMKSARQYHKICPYFDKRTKMCFLAMGAKCDREGKFDACNIFRGFLESKYDEYKAKKMPLPLDFTDVVASPF